ncbi:lytic murein transglycosylase [Croceibacterium mercuriale]|uniref:Lytic murein transglycosylase n=1 Tax=Croceibacterium mercuriale TaxID=1572751 RepID=A0A0B2C1H3_9SPHN|nr:transglycosylase SLT domain-containing protein [Croceibacterium mercuriale]KHL25801.1 lytic murein transglycosylase [Croceibacterium mercuriale]
MIRTILAGIAAAALAGTAAQARTTFDYYTGRADLSATQIPAQLTAADREYYRAVFAAIDRQDWAGAQGLLAQRGDGVLHWMALAQLYTVAGSPRVELPAIQAWLSRGQNLPQAEQLGRLALTRGATTLPGLPMAQQFQSQGGIPKRIQPSPVNDGTMPAEISAAILERIRNDDPDGGRALLDGVDALLSPGARAEWRQRVAWSYYIENRDAEALALARTVSAGEGAWVGEGEWTAGLAAWRLGDCAGAGDAFERAAYYAHNPELRSAAQYWGARAALRCRQPQKSAELLRGAALADETLYGMLAAEQLGTALPARVAGADFSAADWQNVGRHENVRVAIALMEIGQDDLASKVLLHQARIGDAGDYAPLSRLARDLGLPSTQLYMAYNAPPGGRSDPAGHYPAPRWVPLNGWQVDPALAFAHTLQESNFRASAVSPAQAQGLMQITPITVRQHAPRLGFDASRVNIFDPAVNLAFGQQNLAMLRDNPATGGALPKIMAAYNAGLTPITRWNSEINDQGDPLLYMESIPYWETRGYVAIVTRNYWMYERQASADASPSRISLAQNAWPAFPQADGRVYLSAGGQP